MARRFQKIVQLPAQRRGCHVITRKLLQELPELNQYEIGMANLFGNQTALQALCANSVCVAFCPVQH